MTDSEFAEKAREICGTDQNSLALIRVQYDRLLFQDNETVHGVYVQVNEENYVTAIDSDAYISDLSFWLKIDEGKGELYKYAKNNYCRYSLMTDGGYNYRLVDGVVVYAPQIEQPTDHNEMSSKEDYFVASRKYNVGELISIQGRMYEVTSIILSGANINPGSNCVEITLEEYINRKVEERLASL